jgi:hypothetical protein
VSVFSKATVAAVAVAIAASVGARADASPLVSTCAANGLVTWLDTTSNAAAGHAFYSLVFTNLSGRSCALRGYPGVSAVDRSGRALGSSAGRNAQNPVRTIVLASGSSARAVLRVADPGVYPFGTCHSTTAVGFRVYPPNATSSTVVPFPAPACTKQGPTYLAVAAVTG